MGNGPGFHDRGGPRGLQGLAHQGQVPGLETPRREMGVQRAWILGRMVNRRMSGRKMGGPHSPAWSQAAIGLPSRGGFIMARIASGEGAGSRLGSLSSSDWTHKRREEAQVSGLTPGRRAHTPGELPPFTP